MRHHTARGGAGRTATNWLRAGTTLPKKHEAEIMNRATKLAAALACGLAGTLAGQGCGDDDTEASGSDAGTVTGGSSAAGKGGAAGKSGAAGAAGKGAAGQSATTAGRSGSSAAAGSGGDAGAVADQDVTIRFKAKLGDEDLACGREYTGQGSGKIRATPQDFRFFVQSMKLVAEGGAEVPVVFDDRAPFQTKDVALLDFTDGKGSCAPGENTNTTITGKVPAGKYRGVVFSNGVPEALNHQNISVAKAPLQDATMYWGWASGYRFIIAEMLPTDLPATDTDAGASSGASFVHIGASGCAGGNTTGYTCARNNVNEIHLNDFDPETDSIVADLSEVFANVNLETGVECHGPSPACSALYSAIGLDLETGKAVATQSVFRVE
jgi:uncharacterized repeat protein (TIGR04052 family)